MSWTDAFERLENRSPAEVRWITPVRRAAMDRFAKLGFPTQRLESWRYTNVAPIARTRFRLADRADGGGIPRASMAAADALTFGAWGGCRMIFVNGRYDAALSIADPAPGGIRAVDLATALVTDRALIEPHLTRMAGHDDQAFVALNTAFLADGAFVRIPRGVVLDEPIHLVFITAPEAGGEPTVSHPRVLVLAEEGSRASIVESYVGLGAGPSFTNAVTEISVSAGAVVDHSKLQREGAGAYHVAATHVALSRDSVFSSHAIMLGGSIARNDVTAVLGAEGAECTLNGLFAISGDQHSDNHTVVDHASPHGTSRQLYKGVLDGRSRGVFDGLVIVRPDAQKTDSRQENRNLILSEEALVDTKPTLRIHADDVKCSHAATTGRMDEQSLFYLRSRAIDLETARRIMMHAFVSDLIRRIKVDPLRAGLDALLFSDQDGAAARMPS